MSTDQIPDGHPEHWMAAYSRLLDRLGTPEHKLPIDGTMVTRADGMVQAWQPGYNTYNGTWYFDAGYVGTMPDDLWPIPRMSRGALGDGRRERAALSAISVARLCVWRQNEREMAQHRRNWRAPGGLPPDRPNESRDGGPWRGD